MSFFGFGAFSTPVGQLIEKSTDNAASAGNLALHLQICDVVNETDSGPKDAVAAIRKRFTGNTKNFHIISLTLTVLETCVKNCGTRFHSKIAQKDFLQDLMKVVAAKNNPPTIVRERILGLIQYWADAFKGKPQLIVVEELYEQLRSEGVEFPPVDLDNMAPIETPDRLPSAPQAASGQIQLTTGSVAPQPSSSVAPASGGGGGGGGGGARPAGRAPMGPLKPEQVAKLLSELDVVRRNMDIMNEVLSEVEPGKETPDDVQLLDDLNRSLHSMQTRVAGLIERCQDEVVLEGTLLINDDLNTLFVRYERWLRNSAAAKGQPLPDDQGTTVAPNGVATTSLIEPGDSSTSASGISYPNLDEAPAPPSYEAATTPPPPASQAESGGIGQLIDLGTDITSPVAPPTSQQQGGGGGDIVAQLAQLGITAQPSPNAAAPPQPQQQQQPATAATAADDFDVLARSRTSYDQGSTYDDNKEVQMGSLSAALQNRPQVQQNPYSDLTQWLSQTDSTGSTQQPPAQTTDAESATSAEFDQFLAQRATKGDSLPAARPRPQMQKAEDQSDELFAL